MIQPLHISKDSCLAESFGYHILGERKGEKLLPGPLAWSNSNILLTKLREIHLNLGQYSEQEDWNLCGCPISSTEPTSMTIITRPRGLDSNVRIWPYIIARKNPIVLQLPWSRKYCKAEKRNWYSLKRDNRPNNRWQHLYFMFKGTDYCFV